MRFRFIQSLGCGLLAGGVFLAASSSADDYRPREAGPGIFQVGLMRHAPIRESSGLAPSSRTNLFWTHNDGASPVLFAIDRSGNVVAQFSISAAVLDWEDIARDDAGNLYLADTGNNGAKRRQLSVHRFKEPDFSQTNGVLQIARTWTLSFPAQPFDCESLFIWRDHGYVISKVTKDRLATLYRFPLAGTNCVLEEVAELPVTSPVTAADLSGDGKKLGLVCKSGAYLFEVNGDPGRAGSAPPLFASFREGQIEGCCFVPEGLLAVSEMREVFLYRWSAFKPK